MSGAGITYLWTKKEFPDFIRLEGRKGDYEFYHRRRTCQRVTLGLEREREVATVSWVCSECRAHLSRDDRYCSSCGARVEG